MTNDDIIHDLNHLVSVNKDAEAALRTAAENVQNSEVESIFIGYAKQHAKFLAELQAEIERLGGKTSESGTLGGAIERGWMDLKSALSGHSAGAMLSSCESGEQSAEVAYTNAAEAHPSGRTHTLIEKHRQQIIGFRTRLARLARETKDGVEFQKNE
jgi:uncharacterized protein (TIGR02284 family)